MSRHRTLKVASFSSRGRNVLKRGERIEVLEREGRWKDGEEVLGLPKTKIPSSMK
ncbi:MAG: small basic protein [Planctomycetes bacterium]|nr:small basic protein [Planctomycetota bacterium]